MVAEASSVPARPAQLLRLRVDKPKPPAVLLSPLAFPSCPALSRSTLCPLTENGDQTLARSKRRIAADSGRPRRIALTKSAASLSSFSSPKHVSWEDLHRRESAKYRAGDDGTPSPIAAASDLLRPRRILCRVRGEPVPLFDPSSLFPVACIVVLVLVGLSPSAVAIVVATVLVRSLRGRFMVAAVFRVSSPR